MTDHPISSENDQAIAAIEKPRLSNWVWRPWCAKLWWSLIAVYWTGAVGALFLEPFREFYGSGLASLLNIALYPVFALVILSIGWMIAWKDALDYQAAHPEIENSLGWEWSTKPYHILDGRSHRMTDPTNPTSPIFIANANRHLFDG